MRQCLFLKFIYFEHILQWELCNFPPCSFFWQHDHTPGYNFPQPFKIISLSQDVFVQVWAQSRLWLSSSQLLSPYGSFFSFGTCKVCHFSTVSCSELTLARISNPSNPIQSHLNTYSTTVLHSSMTFNCFEKYLYYGNPWWLWSPSWNSCCSPKNRSPGKISCCPLHLH